MKITNRKSNTLLLALRGLDVGRERVVKDGDRERIVAEPFDLTPNFCFAMAVNMNNLETALRSYNKMNADLFRKHAVNGEIDGAKHPVAWGNHQDDLNTLLDQEQEVMLTTIRREELNLDKNKIRLGVLAGLLPIMPDEVKEDVKTDVAN